jgi:YggT family protein
MILVELFNYTAWIIMIATLVMAASLVLRMLLQWAQVNPFGWFALNLRRVTEPVMRPFRYGFDNRTLRFDMLPLVAAALVLIHGFFAAWIVGQVGSVVEQLVRARPVTVGVVLSALVWLAVVFYSALLLMRFLLPILGVGYSNKYFRLAFHLTEPVLTPLRRYLVIGAFDLTPLVVLFLAQFVGGFLRVWLAQW